MPSRLSQPLQSSAPGDVILQSWLSRHAISPSLAPKYVQSGQLKKRGNGVYARMGREPEWSDASTCLQNQLAAPMYVAGLSGLVWQGRSHYLQLKRDQYWLSMENKALLSRWFREFPGVEWIVISGQKLSVLGDKYRVTLNVKGGRLTGSAPELVAYELLSAVPGTLSFNRTAKLFQGLIDLNPRKVECLLSVSQSVQTKRSYLFFTSFYEHGWLRRIDNQKIDLGTGERQIVINDKFNTQYQITVPKHFQKEQKIGVYRHPVIGRLLC